MEYTRVAEIGVARVAHHADLAKPAARADADARRGVALALGLRRVRCLPLAALLQRLGPAAQQPLRSHSSRQTGRRRSRCGGCAAAPPAPSSCESPQFGGHVANSVKPLFLGLVRTLWPPLRGGGGWAQFKGVWALGRKKTERRWCSLASTSRRQPSIPIKY